MQLPRRLLLRLRAVFRRCRVRGDPRRPAVVTFVTGPDGLRARVGSPVPVEYREAGAFATAVATVPLPALADAEGKDDGRVTLAEVGPGRVRLEWADRTGPQAREYAVPADSGPPFPEEPAAWVHPGPGLLVALKEAGDTTAAADTRFALTQVQVRGKAGQVAATDGRQLLVRRGLRFPFPEDVLVPAVGVFAGPGLPDDDVRVGTTATHLAVRAGPWTVWLPADRDARYPDVDAVIPRRRPHETVVTLGPEAAAVLARELPRLPPDVDGRVTVAVNGRVVVQARGEDDGPPAEVALAGATPAGPAVRFATDRRYLARAAALGFAEVRVAGADAPAVCRDRDRMYVWMLLGDAGAPAPAAPRPVPRGDSAPAVPEQAKEPTMQRNGHGPDREPPPAPASAPDDPVAELEALRTVLLDAAARAGRLAGALRQQRRQTKALKAALASLQGLPTNW